MGFKILFILLAVSVPMVLSKTESYLRLRSAPLSKTRCDLICLNVDKTNKTVCRTKWCDEEAKPGTCPKSTFPICVQECESDAHCYETQKCCYNGCGSTCNEPGDLLTLPGLPPLPDIIGITEKRKATIIRWSDGVGDAARAVPGKTLYILQEQHNFNPKYQEHRLGTWNIILRTNKTKASLKNILKPGHWYRFRVAAVSSEGTRGFSKPSEPYILRKGPRPPPAPRKLKVRPLKFDNSSVAIRLQWKEPRSDIPNLRYKVSWSRRVRGLSGDLDSVFVYHKTVPVNQTFFDITDLQSNSMYFLQVQTISQYGTGKLRSEKAEMFYNTTNSNDKSQVKLQRQNGRVEGLKFEKFFWLYGKVGALVSWKDALFNEKRRYIVKWQAIECKKNPHKPRKEHSRITEQITCDIWKLEYNCKYRVTVNLFNPKNTKKSKAELLINVPGCEHLRKTVENSLECN